MEAIKPIRIYSWNHDKQQYEVAKVLPFDDLNRSIKFNAVEDKIFDSEDYSAPMHLTYEVDDYMLSEVIDKTEEIKNGNLKPMTYIEYGLNLLCVRNVLTFAVVREQKGIKTINKLFYKFPGPKDVLKKNEDGSLKFLPLLEVQVPNFKFKIHYLLEHYGVPQTVDDILKENPDEDPEELKKDFGRWIVNEFKNFIFGRIVREIVEMKEIIGVNNNNGHKVIYEIISNEIGLMNKKIEKYNKLAGTNSKFSFNNKIREIEFTE